MKKLPTAREFLEEKRNEAYHIPAMNYEVEAMIEFAKLHVEAALKSKVKAMEGMEGFIWKMTIDEIDAFTRDSYPLEKIK